MECINKNKCIFSICVVRNKRVVYVYITVVIVELYI